MTTLQLQFEIDFPNERAREIDANRKYKSEIFTNWDLDLRKYVNLEVLELSNNEITSVNLSKCKKLRELFLSGNYLTSVDFLNALPNPEKLEELKIHNNKIEPTDISIFSNFINLRILQIGTMGDDLKEGKRNKFYGSLKSYQNLTKLERICIETTDVNEGLEYLPKSLKKMAEIDCSPHGTNAKCKAIQDQLRPFNYDLEAWQLAHPELVEKAKLETPDSERVQRITEKITETKKELEQVKNNEPSKDKKIERIENKLKLLEEELGFLAQENRELKEKVSNLTQKLEQINLISQIEIPPKKLS